MALIPKNAGDKFIKMQRQKEPEQNGAGNSIQLLDIFEPNLKWACTWYGAQTVYVTFCLCFVFFSFK